MIDTKELLQKLSQKLGIPEPEGRLGLEIFSRLISQKLEPGDAVEVASLGLFTFKKVKPISTELSEYQKIIFFSEQKISEQNKNYLLFFLPDQYTFEAPSMDSCLNLSIGKPTILSEKIKEPDFILTASNNELLSLIESKAEKLFSEGNIHKRVYENDEEFIIPVSGDEILFDTGEPNVMEKTIEQIDSAIETNANASDEGKKVTEIFDDFELVEPDKTELSDIGDDEQSDTAKWAFDDAAIKHELKKVDDQSQTPDGYSTVSPNFSNSEINDLENIKQDLEKVETKELRDKPRKNNFRRMIAALAAIIIVFGALGILLNYEKFKSIITGRDGQQYQMIETKKHVDPVIIARTNEIPVTYPYDKADVRLSNITDSLLISPMAFNSKQNTMEQSLSREEIIPSEVEKLEVKLVRVQGNIFQRGSEFVVQISSWKSKSKAEGELKKFTELGYPTELMDYYSSELGKYNKVMVGGFQSLDDARNFLNQNK